MAEKTKTTSPKLIQDFDDAMLAFQKLQVSAVKSGNNPHFKSNYATLEEVIKAASQANEFGLYFTQPLDLIVLGDQIIQVVQTTLPQERKELALALCVAKIRLIHRKWAAALPMPNAMDYKLHLHCHQKMMTEMKQAKVRLNLTLILSK